MIIVALKVISILFLGAVAIFLLSGCLPEEKKEESGGNVVVNVDQSVGEPLVTPTPIVIEDLDPIQE